MHASPINAGSNFRFGVFELNLLTGELRKKGYKLHLQQQPFQLLVLLLDRPNEVISREEIQRKIWGNDTFVDFDHGVNRAINKIREVLGDSAENPRFIETLSKRGYRFIAPVQRDAAASEHQPRKMLVVLPFVNMNPEANQEYFSDGLTEEMITHLSRINPERLGVIARTSAMRFKNSQKDIREIGEELGVEFALEGSVRRSDNRVRITAQLIRVKDQTHLWAQTYDRSMEDVLAIQSDVSERIARSLAFELVPGLQQPTGRAVGSNPEAYELYLHGRYHLNQRVEASYAKAIEYFNRAIQKDPGYAAAHAGLADAYSVIAFYGAVPPKIASQKAIVSAKTAVQLDDSLSEAHTSLGYAILQYHWDWPAAEAEHRRAIELNPGWFAYDWYGFNLTQVGRFDEAFAAMDRARRMDPLSLVIGCHIGWMFYFARAYEKSIHYLEKTVDLDPNFPLARYYLGLAHLQMRDFARGLEQLKSAEQLSGDHPGATSALAYGLGVAGCEAEARGVLEKLKKAREHRHVLAYFLAFATISLGIEAETFEWLEKAMQERSGWPLYLHFEPAFDELRSDRRFQSLLARIHPLKPSFPDNSQGGDVSA